MTITIIPVADQAKGQFNGGEILENKPIGFPQDGGKGKPYSTLFYWAHAWSEHGSTIGEHPHQGFEIISYVLKGTIEHYDSKQKGWNTLEMGGAQVINAGNGISHAEKLNPGSEIFQIWLDPNIRETLLHPASYRDYPADHFQSNTVESWQEKVIAGGPGPMELATEDMEIKELVFQDGGHNMMLIRDSIYSLFCLDGESRIVTSSDSICMKAGDFAILKGETTLELQVENGAKYFLIRSPEKPKYQTYAENR